MRIERNPFSCSENQLIDLSNDECLALIKALQHYQSNFHNDIAAQILKQLEENFPLSFPGERQLPIFADH